MNKTLFFASVFSLGLTFASAQQSTLSTVSATSNVLRQNYEDKNAQDLRALRHDVDAVYDQTPLAGQIELAPYREAVAAAEQALADYKIASDLDLASRKTDLETAKARAIRLWNDYKKTHLEGARESEPNRSESARMR